MLMQGGNQDRPYQIEIQLPGYVYLAPCIIYNRQTSTVSNLKVDKSILNLAPRYSIPWVTSKNSAQRL